MKWKWTTCVLLVLVAGAIRLPAQESDADRKLFDDTKAQAESGDVVAQVNLGECYANGRGVTKDLVDAAKWFRKAAEQGNAIAQLKLGGAYQIGFGVTKDFTEAAKWYRKAAEQGNAFAQTSLG